jgi:hypothetical protein
MTSSGWEAGDIYETLSIEHKLIDSDLTVIKHDSKNNVVLGYTKEGLVFLSCKQYGQVSGFSSGRAKLEIMQDINEAKLILLDNEARSLYDKEYDIFYNIRNFCIVPSYRSAF